MPKTKEITLEHVKQAALNAKKGGAVYGGKRYRYNQEHWCGTSCCIWGHAHLVAGVGHRKAEDGPPTSWELKSPVHEVVSGIMGCGKAEPDDVLRALTLTEAQADKVDPSELFWIEDSRAINKLLDKVMLKKKATK